MGDVGAFLWMALGVAIAVVLPVMATEVKKQFRPTAAAVDFGKYLLLGAFSLVTGLVVLAIYRASNPETKITWYTALLAGYAWEATVEKIAVT